MDVTSATPYASPLARHQAATPGRPCSVANALQVMGEKWALLVVRELFLGNRRFDRIAANTGAPRDILTTPAAHPRARGHHHPPRLPGAAAALRVPAHRGRQGPAAVLHALRTWGDKWAVDEESPLLVLHHDHLLVAGTYCDLR